MRHFPLGSHLTLYKKNVELKTEGTDHKTSSHHYKRFGWSLCQRWKSSLNQPPVDTAAPSTRRPPPQIAFHGLKVAEKGPPFAEEGQISANQPRSLRCTRWLRWEQIVVALFTLQRTGHSRVYSGLLSIHTPKTRQQIALPGTLTPMHDILQSPCPSSSFRKQEMSWGWAMMKPGSWFQWRACHSLEESKWFLTIVKHNAFIFT